MPRRLARFLLPLLLIACARNEKPVAESHPPVILISIDTLRSDHLPAYGYRSIRTPNIDAFRADSILYASAWSHVPLTLPSHVSILTGLLPPDHGVRNNLGYRYDAAAHPAITRALKGAGYDTGAAVSAHVLRGDTGLRDAFDSYDDAIGSVEAAQLSDLQRPGAVTETAAESWISRRGSKPFFFMLHLFEPHAPHTPSYDEEIVESDAIVGRFIAFLRSSGIYDRALIILLSDHGEGLNDHGEEEHGILLYREALQVPLLVKLPAQARRGTVNAQPVQLIDIAPTIASIAGLPWSGTRGRSLLTDDARSRQIYSETFYPRIHLGWSELRSLLDGTHHYIEAPRPELYDLRADPEEKNNILDSERRIYAALKRNLASYDVKLAQPSPVSSEDAARLAALGYIGSPAASGSGPLPDPKDEITKVKPMQDAARLAAAGQSAEAIVAWRAILKGNPNLVAAWTALATELEKQGRSEEAITAWSDAMKHVPQLAPNMALSRASLLLRMGRADAAARDARTAAALNPGAAHHLLARVALTRRDFPSAEREARMAMEDSAYRSQASITCAQALVGQQRHEDALALLDRTLEESRQRRMPVEFLQFARGDLLMTLNRRAEAADAFRDEIRSFPDHLRAYANLGAVYLMEGRAADASAVFEQMLRANPRPASCLVAARVYDTFGDDKTAAEWQRRANTMR